MSQMDPLHQSSTEPSAPSRRAVILNAARAGVLLYAAPQILRTAPVHAAGISGGLLDRFDQAEDKIDGKRDLGPLDKIEDIIDAKH